MTLVEFLTPIKKAASWKKVLAVLYFQKRYQAVDGMTVEQIRTVLRAARVPKSRSMNVADVLAKSGAYVDSPREEGGRRVWAITDTGEKEVQSLLDLPGAEPEIEHDVATLAKLATKIKDAQAREFVDEAIKCLRVGALRAAVIFLWSGAVRTLHNEALAKGATPLNTAIKKHDPKARTVGKVDDFSYIKDKTFLLAAEGMGLLDKGQRGTLEEALNLRNRCGHPTKYKPREKKASSFIEDVVGIVFT